MQNNDDGPITKLLMTRVIEIIYIYCNDPADMYVRVIQLWA